MAKPQSRRVPSDDCEVTVDGEVYRPHEGESVWFLPGMPSDIWETLYAMARLADELKAVDGEPDEIEKTLGLMEGHFRTACRILARQLVRWDWTDMASEPLPQPRGHPETIKQLDDDEVHWLIRALRGQTAGQRGNASAPSPTTSSDTESPGTAGQSSTEGLRPILSSST
jgi:hypothetical protein